jgi:hypothetical protein
MFTGTLERFRNSKPRTNPLFIEEIAMGHQSVAENKMRTVSRMPSKYWAFPTGFSSTAKLEVPKNRELFFLAGFYRRHGNALVMAGPRRLRPRRKDGNAENFPLQKNCRDGSRPFCHGPSALVQGWRFIRRDAQVYAPPTGCIVSAIQLGRDFQVWIFSEQ